MSGQDPRKPDLSHVRRATTVHGARAMEYAESLGRPRWDYLVPTPDAEEGMERLRGRLRAVVSHATAVLEAIEQWQAAHHSGHCAPPCQAASIRDADAPPDQQPSMLPHMTHLVGAVNVAVAGAVAQGLLPEDPGRTWEIRLDRKSEVG